MHLFVVHAIIYGNLHPLRMGEVDFEKKAAAFAVLPDTLVKIEALLQRQLGKLVRFRFRDKRSGKNDEIVPGNDRPIERYPFPPVIQWIFPALDTPQLRFYDGVLRAESLHVQLALHHFSQKAKSDLATRKRVKGVLRSVILYLRKVAKYEDAVFGLLKLHLLGLYYEVAVAFGDVFNERHCLPFDTLFFECFNRYPQGAEQYAFPAAQYVCRVQKYLLSPSGEVERGKELLSGLYGIMENVPRDETLVAVTAALENFVFLTTRKLANPTFKELTTPEFVRKVVRQQKKKLRRCCEIEETAIGRAILLEEIADELAFDFPFSVDTDLSIVHRLMVFLEEERQIYLKKPDAVFKGMAKNRQRSIEMLNVYVNRENRAVNGVEERPQEYGEPVAFAKPGKLGEPGKFVDSGHSGKLVGYVNPDKSVESGHSGKLVGYVNPDKSVESGKSGKYGKSGGYVEPGEFVNSGNPGKLVGYVNPDKFVEPGKPGKSGGYVEPGEFVNSGNPGKYGREWAGEQNAFPSAETYAMQLAVTNYKTFVDTVAFYRFVELEKIKRLNAEQRVQLIHRIVEMPVGYAVPMLKYLGYFDWLKKRFALSNTFIFKHLAKALSATERTVKGNYYVMNPCSNEDASRYNARYYMEKVVKDYEDIAKECEGEGEENRCIPFPG